MQEIKKKVIILFPDDWLSYSPTTINLAMHFLQKGFLVKIIAVDEKKFKAGTFPDAKHLTVEFVNPEAETFAIKIGSRLERYLNKGLISLYKKGLLKNKDRLDLFNTKTAFFFKKLRALKKAIKKANGDILIGVDNLGVLAATSLRKEVHFLSLEISKDLFYYLINWKLVKSLVIQTKERMEYLLPKKVRNLPVFFIQNAPTFKPLAAEEKQNEYKLLYMGSMALDYNGIVPMIKSLYLLPDKYTLHIKSPDNPKSSNYIRAQFPDLLGNRLFIDNAYTDNDKLLDFVSQFSTGFSFYDISTLERPIYNVVSCPSGKLFNYYNAGLPVIGNSIIGLKSIAEYNCGIQIQLIDDNSIARAVLEIENSYQDFSSHAREAAKVFDFTKNADVFSDSLL